MLGGNHPLCPTTSADTQRTTLADQSRGCPLRRVGVCRRVRAGVTLRGTGGHGPSRERASGAAPVPPGLHPAQRRRVSSAATASNRARSSTAPSRRTSSGRTGMIRSIRASEGRPERSQPPTPTST